MTSKRSSGNLILFSADDPNALVGWLVDTFGMQTVLQSLSEQRPGEAATRRASKKGGKKRGRPKGSKNDSKKGGAKRGSKRGSKQGGVGAGRG